MTQPAKPDWPMFFTGAIALTLGAKAVLTWNMTMALVAIGICALFYFVRYFKPRSR